LFGHLSRLDDETQREFFERISLENVSIKKIELWKDIGGRELDGFIKTDDGITIVENKLGTDYNVEQLVDEYNLAKKMSDNVKMLCLSSHFVKPKEIQEAEKALQIKIAWASWSQCLAVIKVFAQKQGLNDQTKQNLMDLVTFMESQGLESQKGFSPNDDWEAFFRMNENCKSLWNHVKSTLQEIGFESEHDQQHYPRAQLPYWGRFYYRYLSAEGRENEINDFGYLVDISIFKGKVQLRFAAYVPHSLAKQVKIPDYYEVTNEVYDEEDYTFYSKYIPIGDLKSLLFGEQMKEIREFIMNCVAETKPVLPQ